MHDDDSDPPRPHDPPWRSRCAHRYLDPDVAAMLARRRRELGWTKSEAERRTGVSRRMLSLLEAGERVPSIVLAADLAGGYDLSPDDWDALSSVALPNVGRDSPYRDGPDALPRVVPLVAVGTARTPIGRLPGPVRV